MSSMIPTMWPFLNIFLIWSPLSKHCIFISLMWSMLPRDLTNQKLFQIPYISFSLTVSTDTYIGQVRLSTGKFGLMIWIL